eukprot:180694_1
MIVFNNQQCGQKHSDVLSCPAIKRIEIILGTFNNIVDHKKENEIAFAEQIKLINHTFITDDYSKSKLLIDFYVIKYDHSIEKNNESFDKVFRYLTNSGIICDISCKHIQRHYIDRTKLFNEYITLSNNVNSKLRIEHQRILQLIARIHIYFIHSYDINIRLTPNQTRVIEQQLNMIDLTGSGELEEKKTEIALNMMKNNTTKMIQRNSKKFLEDVADVNVAAIYEILHKNSIVIMEMELRLAFAAYHYDKNKFINDLIDALTDDSLPLENQIATEYLPNDIDIRNKIYENILFNYIHNH